MLLHQPGDRIGLRRREPEARAQPPRHPRPGDGMVLDPSLGDVMQEQRHVQQRAVLGLYRAHQLGGERRIFGAAGLDLGQNADAAQEMLVDRIVVIHVELHHRHNAAEGANELAEHAGLVHAAEHGLGIVPGREDLEEQPVGLFVLTQSVVDQMERMPDGAHRIRMECEIVLLREMENADQVDRIALEYVLIRNHDPVVVDDEILGFAERAPLRRPEPRHHAAEHRHGFGLAVFELGAQDGGEVADILRDQEVVLHEALDVAQSGMRGVAEPHRDLALDVERQPFLRAVGEEVHVAAHRPQEILAAAEQHVFGSVEDALLDQLFRLAHPVDVFRDPEQRVQVAQPAFAILDVRLDQIAGLPGAAVALLAFGELGGDEFRGGALRHVLVETGDHLVEQLAIAQQEARFEDGGADGDVGLGLPDALVDRARRVSNLEPHVPEAIEDRLRDGLAPCGLLVRQEEQQIDVGARRQQSAAIAAGCDHRHLFGLRTVLRGIEMPLGQLEQQADNLVLHMAQPLRAAAAMPVAQQQPLGGGAAFQERGLQPLCERGPQLALAPGVQLAELRRDRPPAHRRRAGRRACVEPLRRA